MEFSIKYVLLVHCLFCKKLNGGPDFGGLKELTWDDGSYVPPEIKLDLVQSGFEFLRGKHGEPSTVYTLVSEEWCPSLYT